MAKFCCFCGSRELYLSFKTSFKYATSVFSRPFCQANGKTNANCPWWKTPPGFETATYVFCPIVEHLAKVPEYAHPAVPTSIAEPLNHLHGAPSIWVSGHLSAYLMRLQNGEIATSMDKLLKSIRNFTDPAPVVGVHVRRTDKRFIRLEYSLEGDWMAFILKIGFQKQSHSSEIRSNASDGRKSRTIGNSYETAAGTCLLSFTQVNESGRICYTCILQNRFINISNVYSFRDDAFLLVRSPERLDSADTLALSLAFKCPEISSEILCLYPRQKLKNAFLRQTGNGILRCVYSSIYSLYRFSSIIFEYLRIAIHAQIKVEAEYHKFEEYMYYVDQYYNKLDTERTIRAQTEAWRGDDTFVPSKPYKRRVFIATDDPNVFKEAVDQYGSKLGLDGQPLYEFIGDAHRAETASLSTRYTHGSLLAIIADVIALSHTDHLVCTFSSQIGRLAYELMQTHPLELGDASMRYQSLDDSYYYGGQQQWYQTAIVDDKESEIRAGDRVGVLGNHWNGYAKIIFPKSLKEAVRPAYKFETSFKRVDFPGLRVNVSSLP
ncbi:hypothetical protein ACTXT7_002280 [Hymenolepis weldensis]